MSEFLLLFLLFFVCLFVAAVFVVVWGGHYPRRLYQHSTPQPRDPGSSIPYARSPEWRGCWGGGGVKTLVGYPLKKTPHHRRVIWVVFNDACSNLT